MTTLLPMVPELLLEGAFDRGVPNMERIVMRPRSTIDVGNYVVLLGLRVEGSAFVTPVRDAMYWFGSATLSPDDWLFLYTGPGTPTKVPAVGAPGSLYLSYWNRPATILHDQKIVPVIARLGGIIIEPRPEPQIQGPPLTYQGGGA